MTTFTWACQNGRSEDAIDLEITFNMTKIVNINGISGGTNCRNGIDPVEMTRPGNMFEYVTMDDEIFFDQ